MISKKQIPRLLIITDLEKRKDRTKLSSQSPCKANTERTQNQIKEKVKKTNQQSTNQTKNKNLGKLMTTITPDYEREYDILYMYSYVQRMRKWSK